MSISWLQMNWKAGNQERKAVWKLPNISGISSFLFGLKPIGDNGFQYFNVTTGITKGMNNKLVLNDSTFELNTDFIPLPFSSNASLTEEVVFAGFGWRSIMIRCNGMITKKWMWKANGYLFYVVTRNRIKTKALFISSSSDRDKALLARDNKAAGVLLVNGPQFGDKLLSGTFDRVTADVGIPVINISQSVANMILENSGKNINDLEKEIIKNMQTASFSTGEIFRELRNSLKMKLARRM